LSRIAKKQPRFQPAIADAPQSQLGSQAEILRNLPLAERTESIGGLVAQLAKDINGSEIDMERSIPENGLHSLLAVELTSKIGQEIGIELTVPEVTGPSSINILAEKLGKALNRDADGNGFDRVNHESLQRIVDAQLNLPWWRLHGVIDDVRDLPKWMRYWWRKGFLLPYKNHKEGLFKFMWDPPKKVDFECKAITPGKKVLIGDTDFNMHFTVREIVRQSVRGIYQLYYQSGMAHLENFYRVIFWATNVDSKFHKEILVGEGYEMRANFTRVRGPLLDVYCGFYDDEGTLCFEVFWQVIMIYDREKRLSYDFETGAPVEHVTMVEDFSGEYRGSRQSPPVLYGHLG
jgi:acyl-CoA thioesterase FadM